MLINSVLTHITNSINTVIHFGKMYLCIYATMTAFQLNAATKKNYNITVINFKTTTVKPR
jgi:hypothetical protein